MNFKLIAYDISDPKKSEFNGFTFTAESWDEAGKIFCGLTGQYGCPCDKDYNMIQVTNNF